MNSLQSFQEDFSRSVLSGSYNEKLISTIRPGGTLANGSEALRVHENGYYARLTDALGETFEAIWWVLGDKKFFEVARSYIKGNPSVSPNLSDFGSSFPEYLKSLKELQGFPFLYDLGQFEWTFKTVFHSPQHNAESSVDFAQNPISDHSKFQFAPSVQLHRGEHTIYPIWELREKSEKPDQLPGFNKPEHLFITKQNSEIYIQPVTAAEFQILDNLHRGRTLEESLDEAAQNFEVTPETVQTLFQSLAQSGAVVGLA